MTPEMLTGLGVLLLHFREWVREHDPDTPPDMLVLDAAIDVVRLYRRKLVEEGAR